MIICEDFSEGDLEQNVVDDEQVVVALHHMEVDSTAVGVVSAFSISHIV